jgi:Fic family protein
MDEKTKYKFISRGVMEEAIASSQLEGANTTRRVAKQFLREGKKPRSFDEQMILNNYQVMRLIETEDKDKKLDQNIILEWHRMITHKTNVPKKEVGKFRSDKNNIVVGDKYNVIYHCPPKMDFVRKEITRLIKFANDDLEESSFIHPVIKAIMLHFWIGYLHPFTDGNGRLARLLFYWYLLQKDYWAFAYLPISKVIKKSPVQYQNAYIYSEQNDNLDMTYFIDYNIRKIKIANKDFKEYLARKSKENLRMNQLSKKYNINERQIQLLQYLFGDKTQRTSLKVHMNIYQVSKATAIKDLKKLKKIKNRTFISSAARSECLLLCYG